MKVLSEVSETHSLKLELEAEAGTVVELTVRRNAAKLNLHVEGGTIVGAAAGKGDRSEKLVVKFPQGSGYQEGTAILSW